MPTLLLLRHAKSSHDEAALADVDRPLNDRGRRAAPAMARRLRAGGWIPGRVLCSDARRTRETWELAAPLLEEVSSVAYLDELYLADAGEMLAVIREWGRDGDPLLVVGHNPGIQALAVRLAGSGEAEAIERMRRKYPTGALAVLHFGGDGWEDLAPGTGRLQAFVRPKDLPEADEQEL